MNNTRFRAAHTRVAALLILLPIFASADPGHGSGGMMVPTPAGHAPIGVMSDHMHKQGEWMFSYRYMYMDMEGNRVGDNEISPTEIATTIPNRFFGLPMQPPTLRVVPTKMTMEMHMFGAMYAPTDWLTLMAMLNYTAKEMDHITFMGPAGAMVRGGFTTETSGIGDTKLSSMIRLFNSSNHNDDDANGT